MSFSPERIFSVTKADADLPNGTCAGLLVGTAGTLNVMDASGAIVANVPVQAGYNPIRVKQVRAGGTATSIFALY
jgi:ABC-type uncharacterized transport system permease subunit